MKEIVRSRKRLLARPAAIPREGATPRQIEATDAEMEALVYELYGLTEEEIAIVEGRDH